MRKILVACGAVSSVWYVAADIFASRRSPGYRYVDQVFSELPAAGAPARPLVLALSLPYNALVAAFGAAVARAPRRKRTSRLLGGSLIAYAVTSQVTPVFFQMDQRGATVTRRGRLHGPMTLVQSAFVMLAMGVGATLFGRMFRLYTLGTALVLVVFGGWTALDVPRLVAGERTPWLGLKERVNIYATMLWILALAVALLRPGETRPSDASGPLGHPERTASR